MRIFADDGTCRRCSECQGCEHHWDFSCFAPGETDHPEYRPDVDEWWKSGGHAEMFMPGYWGCKHCPAWTPDDPDDEIEEDGIEVEEMKPQD